MGLSMEPLDTAIVDIDKENNIVSYNNQFANMFFQENKSNSANKLDLSNIICPDLKKIIHNKSALLLKNNIIDGQNMLGYFYVHVTKKLNTYQLKIINWLNWIANLYSSLDCGYINMVNLNDKSIIQVEQSSDIHAFNALYPLLMHKPHSFIKHINTHAFYGILRKFINRKDAEYINKNYTNNTYSRLETSLKEQTGMTCMQITEIMEQRNLLKFRHMNQIYIPHTKLAEDILIEGYKDELLDFLLQNIKYELN